MFCVNCGNQLLENAKFCPNCGAKVIQNQQAENHPNPNLTESYQETVSVQKKKFGDGAIDFLSSKISGKQVETIRISMEDMIELLKTHFIAPASTFEEYNEIQKVVNGGVMGEKSLTSKDGNYQIHVSVMMSLGGRMDVLHPGDSNWIRVMEKDTGKVYQYSSLSWGKFKKEVKTAIESMQNR